MRETKMTDNKYFTGINQQPTEEVQSFVTFSKEEIRTHILNTLIGRVNAKTTSNMLQGKNTSISADMHRFYETARDDFDSLYNGLETCFKVSRFSDMHRFIEEFDLNWAFGGKNQKASRKVRDFLITLATKQHQPETFLWCGLAFFKGRKSSMFRLEHIRESMNAERNKIGKPITTGTLNTQSSQVLKTLQILGLTVEDPNIKGNNMIHLNDGALQLIQQVIEY